MDKIELLKSIPNSAVILRPVRWVGKKDVRNYMPVEFKSTAGLKTCVNRCCTFGGMAREGEESAGICDIMNSDLDVIADFPLTKKGLKWLYKSLDTRVDVA